MLSVVIPVFNRQHAIERAIRSVQQQTWQDFEVIVVDDASTDDTASAVRRIGDPRITLLVHDTRRGGSAARNTGIRHARGSHVAFLDSDDEWLPTKSERQLAVFAEAPTRELGLVYCGVERVYADGHVKTRMPRRRNDLDRALLTANVVGESSVGMVPLSVLHTVGGFDESLPSMQDMDLWLRICERFDAAFVPDVLVRVAKGSDAGRISADVARTIAGRELFYRKHRATLVERKVSHVFLRESGWWHHRRARDVSWARAFYRESLKASPLAPGTYGLLLLTWLPPSLLDGLARGKRQGAALLSPSVNRARSMLRRIGSAVRTGTRDRDDAGHDRRRVGQSPDAC